MIAARALAPEPPRRQLQRGRDAARRRVRRAQRRGYVAFARVSAFAVAIVLPVLLYVMLTANLTSLSYKVARADAQRTALLAQTMRQEDRIAKLESRERLAAIAAHLGMRDPQVFAIANVPPERPRAATDHGIAFLGAVNQWLSSAVGDRRP